MEVRSDAVLVDVAETWVRRQQEINPAPRITPVKKTEGSVFRKEEDEDRQGRRGEGLAALEESAINEVVDKTQAFLDDLNIRLDFEVYKETGDLVVRIFNRETEELIRQIPPEDLLELQKKLAELRGVLFDEKA